MTALDWDDLRYFHHAASEGSLARAARALRVEHTTVGRRLSSLERSLGAALVLRGPDGLRLTPLGERAAPLVSEVERAVRALEDFVAAQKARVRLAVPSGFTRFFTAGLAELRRDHPSIALEIVSGAQPVDISRGEADLAVRSGPVKDEALVSRKLCDAGFALYASRAYLERRAAPADLDSLAGHDVIAFHPSLSAMPAAAWLERRAQRANVVLRSREMTDLLTAALAGAGLAVLPCVLADPEPELRRLTPEVIATRPLSLVYRRESRLSNDVRAVIGLVTRAMRAERDRLRGVLPRAAATG